MKSYLGLLLVCVNCLAQSASSTFENDHDAGVKQNPPGVTLTIATSDGRSAFHVSDVVKLTLAFTSNKPRVYTVEVAPGGNTAAASDDFVIQAPDQWSAIHSLENGPPSGIICCTANRKYVREQPITLESFLSLREIRFLDIRELFHSWPDLPEPGEYSIFVQTRRLMRGWPKSEKDKYFKASDIVVTSENVLHITMIPDGANNEGK